MQLIRIQLAASAQEQRLQIRYLYQNWKVQISYVSINFDKLSYLRKIAGNIPISLLS